jgi:hypothetical protein
MRPPGFDTGGAAAVNNIIRPCFSGVFSFCDRNSAEVGHFGGRSLSKNPRFSLANLAESARLPVLKTGPRPCRFGCAEPTGRVQLVAEIGTD